MTAEDSSVEIPGASAAGLELAIRPAAVESLLAVRPREIDPPERVTFARNVFLALSTACRYDCGYCTFVDPPGEASLLAPASLERKLEAARQSGCSEALFTFGEAPGERYPEIQARLAELGHNSVQSYLRWAADRALEAGLLPHANPGDQGREAMAAVADLTASMGVMLETTAAVPAHSGTRSKSPGKRLATIRTAGELRVPFTTGLLVGIGEGWRDRAVSLLAIARLQERYGHIQEVIVQPVRPNERWRGEGPSAESLARVVAMARRALPPEVAVQVPPNLAAVAPLVAGGADDLGGISSVSFDHVNPDAPWPRVEDLRATVETIGATLEERLPVRERFLPRSGIANEWIGEPVGRVIYGDSPTGRRYRRILGDRGGPRITG